MVLARTESGGAAAAGAQGGGAAGPAMVGAATARPPPGAALGRGARWTLAETVAGTAGSLIATVLVARIVGPEGVGTAALAAALVALAQPLVGHAVTNGLVQRPTLAAADIAAALWAMLALALVLAGALAAVALAAPGLLAPGVAPVLAVLAWILPAQAVEGVATGVLLRRQDARALALRGIGAQVAGLSAGVALALAGAGAWAVAGQQMAFFGTAALLAAGFAALPARPAWRGEVLRGLMPYAAASVASGLAQRFGPRLFLLLAAGGAPALAGLLQVAFRVAEQARDLPGPFVHRFALPVLSRLAGDRAAFLRRLEALCLLSGLIFAPPLAGLALCAAEVQALLLGPAWAGVAGPLALLAATLALLAPRLPLGLAFIAAGMPSTGLGVTLFSVAATLLLALVAVGGGTLAAAEAWAAALLLSAVMAGAAAAWRLGFRPWRQLRAQGLSLLPALAVTAAVMAAERAGGLPAGPAAALLAKAAIGAAVGLPLIALLARRPWREAVAPVPREAG